MCGGGGLDPPIKGREVGRLEGGTCMHAFVAAAGNACILGLRGERKRDDEKEKKTGAESVLGRGPYKRKIRSYKRRE